MADGLPVVLPVGAAARMELTRVVTEAVCVHSLVVASVLAPPLLYFLASALFPSLHTVQKLGALQLMRWGGLQVGICVFQVVRSGRAAVAELVRAISLSRLLLEHVEVRTVSAMRR